MTLTMNAPKRGSRAPIHSLPQVNLLPPEVRAARGLTRTKRWLAVVVVLALVMAVGLVFFAVLTQRAADEELALQQAATVRLEAEKEQYAEVPLVLAQLDAITAARQVGMSTEVIWPGYLAAIAATAPEGTSIEMISTTGATPMVLPPFPASVLAAPGVASITFAGRSLTLPDTAAWLDGLETIPGFTDAWFSTAAITESEGLVYYTVNGTVQVTDLAYAERFVATEEN